MAALQRLASTDAALGWLRARGATALRTDSRRLRAGEAFVAWPGWASDGRRFVPAALAAGAAACLVEDEGVAAFGFDDARVASLNGLKAACGPLADAWFGRPSERLDIVAVTGTNGKTSTACWTAQALARCGRRCGVVGTLGIGEADAAGGLGGAGSAGSAGDSVPAGLTTPDPVTLHGALAAFVAQGVAACALEASSIGLAERRLDGLRIDVALFTNFTRDHLDYHGTMAAYWAAKRRLFAWPGLRAAVIDVDDAAGAALADELRGGALDLWTVSSGAASSGAASRSAARAAPRLGARALRYGDAGLAFDVFEGAQSVALRTALVGEFNVANLLVALGALRALGLPLAEAAAALAQASPVPGRLQRLAGAGVEVAVDYAHTPDALAKVLAALRPLARARGGRLVCVFGCGGNRDATKRPLMGAIAERDADRVVLTSDNPRDEAPAAILAQILAGVAGHDEVAVIENRAEAIATAIAEAQAGDVVLLAGKGHEDYQETAGVRRPFSDLDEARAALARRRGARA
ncbi:MAG: UDP-N-acetylmuramoyl-L-alanyl-D-glutamate--2,6-diaminopimelate ligase [Rubrivivax sp.]